MDWNGDYSDLEFGVISNYSLEARINIAAVILEVVLFIWSRFQLL